MQPAATTCDAWVLVGATATGKTAVAHELAVRQGADLLSADALLVYRGMDIGTAKPTEAQRREVNYLGLDLVSPDATFSTGAWLAAVREQLAARDSARPLIVTGGTGLYIKALLGGLDAPAADPARRRHWQDVLAQGGVEALRAALARLAPDRLAQLDDPANPRRLMRALEQAETGHTDPGATAWSHRAWPTIAGLRLPREQLHARIASRVEGMLAGGLVAEAAALRAGRSAFSSTAAQAIGYAEALELHDGRISRAEAAAHIVARTRRLAKRQLTWLRHQLPVAWVDADAAEPVADVAARVLATWRTHGPASLPIGP